MLGCSQSSNQIEPGVNREIHRYLWSATVKSTQQSADHTEQAIYQRCLETCLSNIVLLAIKRSAKMRLSWSPLSNPALYCAPQFPIFSHPPLGGSKEFFEIGAVIWVNR